MDCLFRSHLSDAVVDIVTKCVSVFPFKEKKDHVIYLVLLLLDVTKLVFNESIIWILPELSCDCFVFNWMSA